MRTEKENIKHLYNKALTKIQSCLKEDFELSYKENYEMIIDTVEIVLSRMPISKRISNLVIMSFVSLYNHQQDYTVSEALSKLFGDTPEAPDPSRYSVKFYQRLICRFDERVMTQEYSSLNDVLHQILIDEDVLDEISYIIYFMPQWFKDVMLSRIRADDRRDDVENPDATLIPSSTEEFDGY